MKGPKDPVDHARTTRPHAGESMKDNKIMPGLILIGVALVLFISTLVFGGLVLSLTARLRREEFDMLHAIGCSRSATWKLVALELAGIVSLAAAGAGAGLALLITFAPDLVRVF